jgi:hypothetical protein
VLSRLDLTPRRGALEGPRAPGGRPMVCRRAGRAHKTLKKSKLLSGEYLNFRSGTSGRIEPVRLERG